MCMPASYTACRRANGVVGSFTQALCLLIAFCPFFLYPAPVHGQESPPPLRVLVTPDTAVANKKGTWRVSFVLQEGNMLTGGRVKARFPKGFTKAQRLYPDGLGYVDAATSNPSATVVIQKVATKDNDNAWEWNPQGVIVTALLDQGTLVPGDTLHIIFGAGPEQSLAPRSAFTIPIEVAYDLEDSGVFTDLLPFPKLTVLPGAAYRLLCFVHATAQVGDIVPLRIAVVDEFYNLATDFTGNISLSASDPAAIFPAQLTLAPSDSAHTTVDIVYSSAGIQTLSATAVGLNPDSLWQVESNPTEVFTETPAYRIYWGDLHSHTTISGDGHGTGSFEFAREVMGLGFYALTDHSSTPYADEGRQDGITDTEWEETKQALKSHNDPGSFVTIPGYEFSADSPSGHHNLYFNAADDRLDDIPLYYRHMYGQIQSVWGVVSSLPPDVQVLTIPHHTGMGLNGVGSAEVSFGEGYGDDALRPLIEIYSEHGLSELYDPAHPLSYESISGRKYSVDGQHYAQDAWALGERLSVIASSDNHSAHPGLPSSGLTAVYATELTRDGIFEALENGRTYGTTGQRLLLDFKIDDQLMGSEVVLSKGALPSIYVSITGTDDLALVEVLRWTETDLGGDHPNFETVLFEQDNGSSFTTTFTDDTFTGPAIYYVRAKQKGAIYDVREKVYKEIWAWSSPIHVDVDNRDVVLAVTPNNPPVELPTSGGDFTYTADLTNTSAVIQPVEFWTTITKPDGSELDILGPIDITLDPGETGSTTRTQSVPGIAPTGDYRYNVMIGMYASEIMDSTSFPFKKLSALAKNEVRDAHSEEHAHPGGHAHDAPASFTVLGNHPNPFNPTTVITFNLPVASPVALRIYDLLGRRLTTLIDMPLPAGIHHARWDAHALPSGVYLYHLEAGDFVYSGRMILSK